MKDISLEFDHNHGLDEAKQRLEEKLDEIARKFKLTTNWTENICHLSGAAKGTVCVSDNSVKIDVKLGFAAKIFKSQIESRLKEGVAEVLA